MEAILKLKPEELHKKRVELREEIADLRRGIKTGDVQNTQVAKLKKRELARIEMLIKHPVEVAASAPVETKKPAKTAAKKESK